MAPACIFVASILAAPVVRADYVWQKVFCEFFPTNSGPENPSGRLVEGNDGDFYGTSINGGEFGNGTIFRITPTGELTTLSSFDGFNGMSPNGGLVKARDGNYYGVTLLADPSIFGNVFRATPDGTLSNLFSFQGTNGSNPFGPLTDDNDGSLYGITGEGGIYGLGTIFRKE